MQESNRSRGAGRPVWDPRLLISLWLYAYKGGVSSAREIARLCEYHPGLSVADRVGGGELPYAGRFSDSPLKGAESIVHRGFGRAQS